MENEARFFRPEEGETILCYHGKNIYEAKCLKLRQTDLGTECRIQFIGWGRGWDQWIGVWEKRILQRNEANLRKKDALETQQIIERRERRARLMSPPKEAQRGRVTKRKRGRTPGRPSKKQ
ncbi:mortality factor 4-like protein 1 [Nilaparvata lugens]|uniref:mortality factor 4-like protein 1 n=1 Tax=Nilaparvata lugens TaxID=108931 RepID=UPI00193E362E|nr:mortality factor 4-like protein 1 [Nilaparvata lugens]